MQSIDDKLYRNVLSDISALYEAKIGKNTAKRNALLVQSYWEIGDRIVRCEKEAGIDGRYGRKLIEQLSTDLSRRFGDGFGRTNMFMIRRFRLAYNRTDIRVELTWSHYKTLLSVKNERRRRTLAQRAIDLGWSDTKLQGVVMQEKRATALKEKGEELLTPRDGRLHLYKVVLEKRGGRNVRMLDCGFNVKRKLPLNGVTRVRQGMYLESVKSGAGDYRFSKVACEKGERYTYVAEVLHVVDGDTVLMRVDLGFDTFIDERFRLRGVDAPEMNCAKGRRAGRYVASRLQPGSAVLIYTYGSDVYGRYVADVFYSGSKIARYPNVHSGTFLNLELIENGYAGYLKQ